MTTPDRSAKRLGIVVWMLAVSLGLIAWVAVDQADAMAIYNKTWKKAHVFFSCDDCFSPGWDLFGKDLEPGESTSYPGESGTVRAVIPYGVRVECHVDDHGWAELTIEGDEFVIRTFDASGGLDCMTRDRRRDDPPPLGP